MLSCSLSKIVCRVVWFLRETEQFKEDEWFSVSLLEFCNTLKTQSYFMVAIIMNQKQVELYSFTCVALLYGWEFY